jgi:predicted dehydrogenase
VRRVAIIGCGLLGQKRALALAGSQLAVCADLALERAERLAHQVPGCQAVHDWSRAVERQDIDIVIIATPHASLAAITLAALSAGKHVLVEKPAARHVDELTPVLAAAKESDLLVRVGFNHRYHRALRQAHDMCARGDLGEIMFLRAHYGHGGRLGYNKEWRAQPALSGGGELIDQGVHLIDLARWFLGDFPEVHGFAHTYFWDMPVDDNAFLVLKTAKQQVAFLHASCTEWKNLFSLEIYGRDGKLHIEGLGGSYGIERLAYYKMLPQMGPPETTIWEYPMADDSMAVEFAEFLDDIELGRQPGVGLADAQVVLAIVEQVYRESGYDHHA